MNGMKASALFSLLMLTSWLPAKLQAQAWSGIISPSRAIDWTGAGVIGGIPSASWPNCTTAQAGTTVPIPAYGTLGSPGSPATINNALTACASANPSGSVLQLGAGTFYIYAASAVGINFGMNSNVVLRGQGANQTTVYPVTEVGGCGGIWAVICIQGGNAYIGTGGTTGSEQNVCDFISGYSQGSTTISLANCGTTAPGVGSLSNLKIGSLLMLDQLSEQTDTGQIWNCQVNYQESSAANACSSEGGTYRDDGTCVTATIQWSGNWCVREQSQVVRVTNCTNTNGTCTSSSNLTIDPGIRMPNWTSTKLPQAWYANYYLHGDGIENLTVNTGDPASGSLTGGTGAHWPNLVLYDCFNCWIKGVESLYADRSHVMLNQCQHCEVRDSYFFQNIGHATQSYGVEFATVGESKFENNIGQAITAGLPINTIGGEANLIDYNYVVRTDYTATTQWMQQGIWNHNSGDAFNLYEGNIGNGWNSDDVHGTHHFMTFFRNYMTGWQTDCNGTGCTASTYAMKVQAGSRFYNLIGNVVGAAGYQTTYQCLAPQGLAGNGSCPWYLNIWELGYAELGTQQLGYCTTSACTSTVSVGYDPITLQSLVRWGNYDTVTASVHWCGGASVPPNNVPDTGWSTTCASTTEVPAASFSPYGNAIPSLGDTGAGQSPMPASFIYSSPPAWWGNHAWPSIGPDVTTGNVGICSGGTYKMLPASSNSQCTPGGGSLVTGLAGHVNLTPAMDCYLNVMGGAPDGEGSAPTTPLNFNAASCYQGVTSGGGPQPPGPVSSTIN